MIDLNRKANAQRKARKAQSQLLRSSIAIAVLLLLVACNKEQIIYYSYQPVTKTGWSKTDTLAFTFPIDSTQTKVYITPEIRFTSEYPYQNISLAVAHIVEDSIVLRTDTLHYELRNNLGQHTDYNWSSLFSASQTLPVLRPQYFGPQLLKLWHIMETDSLRGISDIGIKVARQPAKGDESDQRQSEGK